MTKMNETYCMFEFKIREKGQKCKKHAKIIGGIDYTRFTASLELDNLAQLTNYFGVKFRSF